jgi:hypothetical protein
MCTSLQFYLSEVRLIKAEILGSGKYPHPLRLLEVADPGDHEWQAWRIVGERQTSSELEYEVNGQKTL